MRVTYRPYPFAKGLAEENVNFVMPNGYNGHTTLAYTGFYNGVPMRALRDFAVGGLRNARLLSPQTALDAVRNDTSSRDLDEADRAFIDESERKCATERQVDP
jgi:hypothetical protein